jgi:hypothetical protein
MIVATGERDYISSVLRARDAEILNVTQRLQLLARLVERYPEAVAAVMDEAFIPVGQELNR